MFSLLNDTETFLDIEGYEGLYSISNMGRVYSHSRYNKILSPYVSHQGYHIASLCKDGVQTKKRVHVLVGNHFVGKSEGELTYDHYPDRDKNNNRADNLRLATKQEQCLNRSLFKNNTSGEKNICIQSNLYRIQIRRNGKLVVQKNYPIDKYTLADVVNERNQILKKL